MNPTQVTHVADQVAISAAALAGALSGDGTPVLVSVRAELEDVAVDVSLTTGTNAETDQLVPAEATPERPVPAGIRSA